MTKKLTLFLTLFIIIKTNLPAQLWRPIATKDIPNVKNESIDFKPNIYLTYEVDDESLVNILRTAPHEKNVAWRQSSTILSVPNADGIVMQFKIVEYDMMEQGLKNQFPRFKTYYGRDVNNTLNDIRIDHTLYGFRAVIREEAKSTYIDYYFRDDNDLRIVYFKHNYPNTKEFSCEVHHHEKEIRSEQNFNRQGDCKLRTYRLANAGTGEYTTFHGGTVAGAQAAIVTSYNRVNQIYESDIAVRLILIANNNTIIYTNSGTDPYTNNNGSVMLGENQTNINSVIGSANYDIGHVFSTGGGGIASLQSVCSAGNKARGVTGSSSPIGDPFDIDYVAHEVGHQFGGNHTFNNNNTGSCAGSNNNPGTSVEVGSGTTIMAYAGICGSVNVQSNSDALFHAVSLAEIKSFIMSASHTCDVETTITNLPPTITNLPNYTIPISTPFVLTGIASDPENDPMTYAWEQMDIATATAAPTSSSTNQANFRCYVPNSNPSRYFPKLTTVLNNASDTWEVLPTVSRNMNFRMTVRDHTNTVGCTSEDDVIVSTVASAGPFTVTILNSNPNTPALLEGQNLTVTWNVANTNLAPINCANVDILLSYDGGLTYTTALVTATPNDGSQDVTIPTGTTTQARIMVKANGNIFYDVNNFNFTINTGGTTFLMNASPSSINICNTQNAIINITTTSLGGYTTPISLTAVNGPAGAIYSFSSSTINPGQSSILTISNLSPNIGNYQVSITGTSGSIVRNSIVSMTLNDLASATLSSPANNQTNVSITPTLTWTGNGASYEYEVSRSANFSSTVTAGTVSNLTVTLSTPILGASTYYWRIRPTNGCGVGNWTASRIFHTEGCFVYSAASGLPLTIPVTVATVTSTLPISDKGIITDVNVSNLVGTHTWINDLKFTLLSPINDQSILFNQICSNQDNFNVKFNDQAASSTLPCPPTDGLEYIPNSPLNVFNGDQLKGSWKLKVEDLASDDGGQLQAWSLRTCVNQFCRLEVQNDFLTGAGSLKEAVRCASSGDTIRFAPSLNNMTLELGDSSLMINKNLVFLSTPANNITIQSQSSINPTFEITSTSNVKILGLKFIASPYTVCGFRNSGLLTLSNASLLKNPSIGNKPVLLNNSSSQATVEGNSRID